jgi:hypothetical protein
MTKKNAGLLKLRSISICVEKTNSVMDWTEIDVRDSVMSKFSELPNLPPFSCIAKLSKNHKAIYTRIKPPIIKHPRVNEHSDSSKDD